MNRIEIFSPIMASKNAGLIYLILHLGMYVAQLNHCLCVYITETQCMDGKKYRVLAFVRDFAQHDVS